MPPICVFDLKDSSIAVNDVNAMTLRLTASAPCSFAALRRLPTAKGNMEGS